MNIDKAVLIDSVQIQAGTVAIRSDGIMLIRINEDYIVDIPDLKDITVAAEKIGKGKRFPNLVVVGTYANITQEARDYSTSDENNIYTKADAFVIRATHQKLLANLYLKINRPKIPTWFFDNEEDAVAWLQKYI